MLIVICLLAIYLICISTKHLIKISNEFDYGWHLAINKNSKNIHNDLGKFLKSLDSYRNNTNISVDSSYIVSKDSKTDIMIVSGLFLIDGSWYVAKDMHELKIAEKAVKRFSRTF